MAFESIKRTRVSMKENAFLFQQLISRDFMRRYRRSVLGIVWSLLSPLMQLAVMMFVFSRFFGAGMDHYTIYLFAGNITWGFFNESTTQGMFSLMSNAGVLSKINVPKYLFLLSQNVSATLNYVITIVIFFLFCIIDGVTFTPKMLMLWYPFVCLVIMCVGIGMVLSALFVFFSDIQYLYGIFLTLLSYVSAIFYSIDGFSPLIQRLFLLNPLYANINYWRIVVLHGQIPSLAYHGLLAFYAALFLGIGAYFYKHFNHRFVYYF